VNPSAPLTSGHSGAKKLTLNLIKIYEIKIKYTKLNLNLNN